MRYLAVVKSLKLILIATLLTVSTISFVGADEKSDVELHSLFSTYIEGFNSQDVDEFANQFYAEDITFERKNHRFTHGRAKYIEEYHASHNGLIEILRPERVLVDGNNIAAELNVDFLATKDQPNFIIMPLKAGAKFTIKMFAFYTVKNGQFSYIKVARWEPGQE